MDLPSCDSLQISLRLKTRLGTSGVICSVLVPDLAVEHCSLRHFWMRHLRYSQDCVRSASALQFFRLLVINLLTNDNCRCRKWQTDQILTPLPDTVFTEYARITSYLSDSFLQEYGLKANRLCKFRGAFVRVHMATNNSGTQMSKKSFTPSAARSVVAQMAATIFPGFQTLNSQLRMRSCY